MEYKDSYGKTVLLNEEKDLWGKKINNNLKHVVTRYIDGDTGVVGIYPLEDEGYTKDEILSFQPMKHEIYAKDLTLVED